MTVPDDLHWNEPDTGCVSCGQTVWTIDDHRCGTCLDEPVRHCPHCLGDVGDLIDREVARRVRAASWAVSQAFVDRDLLRRITAAERAVSARKRGAA